MLKNVTSSFANSSYNLLSSSGLMAAVASSRIANFGLWKNRRAHPTLCFSPPESTSAQSWWATFKGLGVENLPSSSWVQDFFRCFPNPTLFRRRLIISASRDVSVIRSG
mmetsp:Transcript_802/g.1002  ORF Transcript_802/g.1002 Transcript_802/m.1002 type:complete len:109 (-) Transcript_802:94-420(-)